MNSWIKKGETDMKVQSISLNNQNQKSKNTGFKACICDAASIAEKSGVLVADAIEGAASAIEPKIENLGKDLVYVVGGNSTLSSVKMYLLKKGIINLSDIQMRKPEQIDEIIRQRANNQYSVEELLVTQGVTKQEILDETKDFLHLWA